MSSLGSDVVSNVADVALVFEGGGMRASYSSGVLSAFLEAGIYFNWVGGISAGATCTANYLSRDAERARKSFTDLVQEPNFGGLSTFVRGRGLFNAEWIYEQTSGPGQALPFDWETFRNNQAQFAIGAIRCEDGEMVYWDRSHVQAPLDLMRRVRASSTMPILMPWTDIDGTAYADGALGPTGGFAVDAARAAGYKRFVVVFTRERGYWKRPARYPRAIRLLLRRFPAVAAGLFERPANYNRAIEELLELEDQGRAHLIFPEHMPIGNNERDPGTLRAMYVQGRAQARQQTTAIREFVDQS